MHDEEFKAALLKALAEDKTFATAVAAVIKAHINDPEESQFERFLREHPAPAPVSGKFPEQVFPDGYRRYKQHLKDNGIAEE